VRRLILYSNKLALHGAEVFELLCFSCGMNGSNNKSSGGGSPPVDGCVEALFYIALNLQAVHLPHLALCPGVDTSLSTEHNAIVLLK
jgi:hypothetical protein